MTYVGEIIAEAFREASLITELEHPTPTQTTKALVRLQSIIAGVFSFEIGEPLVDFSTLSLPSAISQSASVDNLLPENVRILITATTATTLFLPTTPANGARLHIIDPEGLLASTTVTLNANGSLIESSTTLALSTGSLNRQWIYDRDVGNWVRVTDITISSEMPFPEENDDYFITSLAMRLSPRYRKELTGATIAALNKSRSQMRARFNQTREMASELGLLPRRSWSNTFATGF